MFREVVLFWYCQKQSIQVMNTKFIFTILAFCILGAAKAQHFDKPKVKAKNQTYNTKTFTKNVFLDNEKNQYRGKALNYRIDTLNLSGLALKEAHMEAIEKVKKYLIDERGLSLEKLPNISTEWYIFKNGQVKEVTFMFPKDIPLTPQDFEEMEKIITQTKVKVTQPQLYKSVDFMPVHISFIWKKPLR
jgi:hypothetical protein